MQKRKLGKNNQQNKWWIKIWNVKKSPEKSRMSKKNDLKRRENVKRRKPNGIKGLKKSESKNHTKITF